MEVITLHKASLALKLGPHCLVWLHVHFLTAQYYFIGNVITTLAMNVTRCAAGYSHLLLTTLHGDPSSTPNASETIWSLSVLAMAMNMS